MGSDQETKAKTVSFSSTFQLHSITWIFGFCPLISALEDLESWVSQRRKDLGPSLCNEGAQPLAGIAVWGRAGVRPGGLNVPRVLLWMEES